MEKVLYKENVQGEFTAIYAEVEAGQLTITVHEMGEFEREYSRDGEVETYVYFDATNTTRLKKALGARDGAGLLGALKKEFGRYGNCMKSEICGFCDEQDIQYTSQTYY